MPEYRHFQKLSVLGVLVLLGFLITEVDIDKLSGAPSSNEFLFTETAFNCQISGTITDVSSGMPVQNTKISLLRNEENGIHFRRTARCFPQTNVREFEASVQERSISTTSW